MTQPIVREPCREGAGGGIYAFQNSLISLNFSTVSDNSTGNGTENTGLSSRGGGIGKDEQTRVKATYSIIAGNISAGSNPNFSGFTAEQIAEIKLDSNFNLTSGDPMLAPLGYYGGPTQTSHPLAESPAILSGAATERIDQRGFTFTGPPTIGAVKIGTVTTVSNLNDNGNGSLRAAISSAAPTPGSIIRFDPSLAGETVTLSSAQLEIPANTNGLFIDASDLVGGITIDADASADSPRRVLRINNHSTVALQKLTLTGGRTSDGVFKDGGSGGGIWISSDSFLTFNNSTLSHNSTGSANNTSFTGFGGRGGGISSSSSTLIFNHSTLSYNSTGDGKGSGKGGFGGCIFSSQSSLEFYHTTISNNFTGNGGEYGSSGAGGGIYAISLNSSLIIKNSTLSHNSSGDNDGGGIRLNDRFDQFTIKAYNSIIAGNTGAGSNPNISGFTAEQVAEIELDTNFNMTSGDPMLAPLGNYGGDTQTRPPLPGSPAIDAGLTSPSGIIDQRGLNRFVGTAQDIGSAEYQGPSDIFLYAFDIDSDSDGSSNGLELALGTNPLQADTEYNKHLRFVLGHGSDPHFTFGLDHSQQDNITLKLMRSLDLVTFNHEITSNANAHFDDPGANLLMIEDDSPPAGGKAFYRLEAYPKSQAP